MAREKKITKLNFQPFKCFIGDISPHFIDLKKNYTNNLYDATFA